MACGAIRLCYVSVLQPRTPRPPSPIALRILVASQRIVIAWTWVVVATFVIFVLGAIIYVVERRSLGASRKWNPPAVGGQDLPTVHTKKTSTWEIISSLSTAATVILTCVVVLLTYETVVFNEKLIAEPRLRIENAQYNKVAVGSITTDSNFCVPIELNFENYSDIRVLQFEVVNESEVNAPKLKMTLTKVQRSSTVLAGFLVQRVLKGVVVSGFTCSDLGISLEKLKGLAPGEFSVPTLAGQEALRVSLVYAHLKNEQMAESELLVSALPDPDKVRFASSGDHVVLPLEYK